MKKYKIQEYSEFAESSFFRKEFDDFEGAKNFADEIGIDGEVWEVSGEEEVCVYYNREEGESNEAGNKRIL